MMHVMTYCNKGPKGLRRKKPVQDEIHVLVHVNAHITYTEPEYIVATSFIFTMQIVLLQL